MSQRPTRYSINPFEILATLAMLSFVGYSAYQLVIGHGALRPLGAVRERIQAQDQTSANGSRQLASVGGIQELSCAPQGAQGFEVKGSKVRLAGALCGSQGAADAPLNPTIKNASNESKGSVFVDLTSGRFMTDYLALAPGDNRIEIDFPYRDGRMFKKTITVKMISEN